MKWNFNLDEIPKDGATLCAIACITSAGKEYTSAAHWNPYTNNWCGMQPGYKVIAFIKIPEFPNHEENTNA